MAEGDGAFYNQFKVDTFSGEHNLGQDQLYMMLVSGYSPDIDTHSIYDHVSGEECSGTGYGTGGLSLSGEALTLDLANDRAKFDSQDVNWDELELSGNEPSHCILYNYGHPQKKLISYWEIATQTNGGDFVLQFSANGLMTFT